MAVTITNIKRNVKGNKRVASFDVTGPASYVTGGEVLTLAQLEAIMAGDQGKLAAVDFTKITSFESERDVAGRQLVLDRANNKMIYMAAGAEVANATNLSAIVIKASCEFGGQEL